MDRSDLESLATSKDTTPEALAALMNDQGYFEQIFQQDYPIDPEIEFIPTCSGWYEPGRDQGR